MSRLTVWALVFLMATPVVGAANDAPPPAPTLVDNGVLELVNQVAQLQAEIQQLRGMVEEQSQLIADLQRKQNNMYTDLDSRLQNLTPPAAAVQAPPVGAPASVPASPVASPVGVATAPVSAPAAPSASAAASLLTANKGAEKDRYQFAYETLRAGHYEQAVKLFENLLADFPNGEYADNSQYWLGEAYKINRETDKARAAFNKVLTQYPNSIKASDALLKLGYIESEQQNTVKAKEILNRVVNQYPGSPAAFLASKKLAQMP
jgi:tol-pal system protein YbgF